MSDKFFFFSKSKNADPGKGVNEVGNPKDYKELKKIDDWRKMLSNFHVCPFKYDGHMFNSIEHAFHYKKIEIVDKKKAFDFTLDSKSALGKGTGEDARAKRKMVVLNERQISEWNKMSMNVMAEAAKEKYKQCPEAMDMLKKTKDAELWHIAGRGQPNVRFLHLEKIRAENAGKSKDEIEELDKEMKKMNIEQQEETMRAVAIGLEETESERSDPKSESTETESEAESKRSVKSNNEDEDSYSERTSRRGRTIASSRTVSDRSASDRSVESEESEQSGEEGDSEQSGGEGDDSVESEQESEESEQSVEGDSEQSGDEGDDLGEIGIRTISSKDESIKSKPYYLTKEQREELKKQRSNKPEMEIKVEIAPITEELLPSSVRSVASERKTAKTGKKMSIEELIDSDSTLESMQKNIQLKIMEKMHKSSVSKKIGKLQDYEKYQVIKMVYNIIFYGVRFGSDGLADVANKVYDLLKEK